MINLPYELILSLIGLIFLSSLIGAPLAFYLIGNPVNNKTKLYPFIYSSLIIGYGLLLLILLGVSVVLQQGYASLARPVAFLLAIASVIYMLCKTKGLCNLLLKESPNITLLGMALIATSAHIFSPVLAGYWDMAYATGDDAARWFMVVNYFQNHFFEYHKVTDASLAYKLAERPMQISSGAILMAIFGIKPALAYSLSAASAMLMSAASFMLIFEGLFSLDEQKKRYMLWLITGLFFGCFGSFINYYFTGRTTHHYSIYPMLFSFGFVAIEETFWKRAVWFTLANLFLALGYSIRFPMNYIAMAGCMIGLQWLVGQITFRMLLSNALAMLIGVGIACIASWTELKTVLASDWQGFFMQRPGHYGLDGSSNALDVFLKWSGVIGTYETALELSPLSIFLASAAIAVLIFTAVYVAASYYRRFPAYTALLAVNFAIGLLMFSVGNYYVAWKSSLYWTAYILLGAIQGIFLLLSKNNKIFQFIGYALLAVVVAFICFTSRQLPMYKEMVDERVTKVDAQSYEMVQLLKQISKDCPQCKPQIFGFDYSAERHLLLREIFRDFEWQPIRGKELWFEHDVFLHQSREELDQYRYEFLLYGAFSKCDLFDFSGNKDALIYDRYPFKIYGPKSSLLEPIKGIELARYGSEAENHNCGLYGGEITDDKAELIFANNGEHSWLDLSFRAYGKGSKDLQNIMGFISSSGNLKVEKIETGSSYTNYTIRISNLRDYRIIKVNLKRQSTERILLTKAKWGIN